MSDRPARTDFKTTGGLGSLGPRMVELTALLDDVLARWARQWECEAYRFPPLIPVEDLARIDYFKNFPHLAVCATGIREEAIGPRYQQAQGGLSRLAADTLKDSGYVLQSAACYNIYLSLRGERLAAPRYVTTLGTCFRNEQRYESLERLLAFQMRELVCIGPASAVEAHLTRCRDAFATFSGALGLDLTLTAATDPFFGTDPARAKMQRLFPNKHEFLFQSRLAVASVNAHRNFFGERCEIRLEDESFAYSGCFGVGLERFASALIEQAGGVEPALERARAYSPARGKG
jgi:seryl-tRNA synthetase